MKPIICLHCTSPVVFQSLAAYLGDDFSITQNPHDPSLTALLCDHCPPSSFIKEFHDHHPHLMIYFLIEPQTKVPSFPFPIKVLERPFVLKKLKHHLSEPLENSILVLNEFKLYLNSRRLIHNDSSKSCVLTEKETEILAYLYEHHPTPISRDILLKEVWNYMEGVTTHTVETHIYKLKQKVSLTSGKNLLKTTEEGYSLDL